MSTFLIMYFAIYGGMNAYALSKARAAYGLGLKGTLGLALLGLLMVSGPVLVRVMERAGMSDPARPIAMLVMAWFGFVFIFFSSALATDLYRLAAWASRGALPALGARTAFHAVLVFSLAVSIYGVFEARGLRTERISIEHKGLPAGRSIKIVQISDLHLGPTQGEGTLRKVLEAVKAEAPDIIVSTGDLVDGLMSDTDGLAQMLAGTEAPLGKFAVMGNHEYYAGVEYSIGFHGRAGFRMLRDDVVRPAEGLMLAGADFRDRVVPGSKEGNPGAGLFDSRAPGDLVVLLRHVPAEEEGSGGRVHLQLSGHTHNGQIFPFSLVTRLVYPYITGDYDLPGGGRLHVSRGTGSWGPPMRVLSPPELTVIEIADHG
jgi:predicted MPP superfamily phosphohydrolase